MVLYSSVSDRCSGYTRPASNQGRGIESVGFNARISGFAAQHAPPSQLDIHGSRRLTGHTADHQSLAAYTAHRMVPLVCSRHHRHHLSGVMSGVIICVSSIQARPRSSLSSPTWPRPLNGVSFTPSLPRRDSDIMVHDLAMPVCLLWRHWPPCRLLRPRPS